MGVPNVVFPMKKTKQGAIRDMKRSVVSGTAGFLYQYTHNGWDWCTEASYRGEACKGALAKGETRTVLLGSTGAVLATLVGIEPVRV